MEELQRFLDQIIYDGYRLRDIALGLVILGIIIILTKKLLRAVRASKDEGYTISVICRRCGWKGRISKYAKKCPQCGKKIS
jgi:rRNA maturation protein Nop10